VDDAMFSAIKSIYIMAKQMVKEEYLPPDYSMYKKDSSLLFQYLNDWCCSVDKSVVLFLDEIDSLYDEVLVSVLRQLRNGFQIRPKAFPASIALVGLRDIREYKLKIRELDGSLGSGSPFNIKAESYFLKGFTRENLTDLFAQYTSETGQVFKPEITDLIHDYTNGQPWLVNAMANHIVVKILNNDYSREITAEIVNQAKEELIQRRDTHLDSLTDKLQESRVKPIVQAIINGETLTHDTFNDDLKYCIDLGIVKDENNEIKFANKIYAEIIPRVLNFAFQKNFGTEGNIQWYVNKDESLNMDLLLREFQQFYRENSESWLERFSYKEAGHQLLLMAFLQRVINGGGQIEREMALGNGRTDLVVSYKSQVFVLELKIKRDNFNMERSKQQLTRYLDKLGEPHGYLVLFEPKPSTEIAWESRIRWEEMAFTWNDITKKITLVEM